MDKQSDMPAEQQRYEALRAENEALRAQAERDALTGLFNRDAFLARAARMIGEKPAGYYIMACFDIDKFRVINDRYGSEKGDAVLRFIAGVFERGFTAAGGICCRVMADQFAVLYPKSFSESGALARLRAAAAAFDGSIPSITFSIGRYTVTDKTMPVSAMYDRAALAEASVKDRFDVCIAQYDESMREKLLLERQIINDMQGALKNGEFEVWLQPQYNHASGALIGAEALVRWRHPQRGVLLPGYFLPLFERNGFIYEMDKFVWTRVCALLRDWLDSGVEPPPVSVNISGYDAHRADFFATITSILEQYRIPVTLLRLEFTESAFASFTDDVIQIVSRLTDYGFVVEIDDFGGGYSSLSILRDVSASILKLDARMLTNTGNAQRGGNILESVVRMCKWLGLPVIAEGVETWEQADFLKSIGCNYMQGYLYAHPMPVSEFEERMAHDGKEHTRDVMDPMDNDTLWDPASMETLLFNSYVGGACIFACSDEKIEVLRVNEKYAQIMLGAGASIERALAADVRAYMDAEDKKHVRDAILRAIETGEEAACELCLHDLTEGQARTYICLALRVLARAGGEVLLYGSVIDLTAQRIAEQRQREALSQLQIILENVNGGVSAVTVDANGKISYVFANEQYYSMFGYTREQYEREVQDAFLLVHPDDRARILSVVRRVMAQKQPETYEYRCNKRDGTMVHVRCNASVTGMEGVSGDVLLSVTTDITPLVEAEARLNEASAELHRLNEQRRQLLENLPCGAGVYEYAAEGLRVVYLNERYKELVNRSAETLSLLPVLDVVHPDDRAGLLSELDDAVRASRTLACDLRILHGSGDYRYFRLNGSIARQEDGRTLIYATYTPISTEEISIREMLPVALAAMMESSSDLSFVKDRDLNYICCSRAFANMVGLQDETEIAGKSDYDIFERPLAEKYRNDDHKLMESGQSLINYVEHIPSEDGGVRYSNTSKYLLHDSLGNVIGLYGVGRDVTENREAYARLKLLTDTIPGGVAMLELSKSAMRVIYMSDGICMLTGYDKPDYEALTRDNPLHFVFEEDLPFIQAKIGELLTGEASVSCVCRVHTKDGGFRYLDIRGAFCERNGENVIANIVMFDITEPMRLQQQLSDVVHTVPCGICLYRWNGETLHPLLVNAQFSDMLGEDAMQYLLMSERLDFKHVHPDDIEGLLAEVQRALHETHRMEYIYRSRHLKTERYMWVHLRGTAVEQPDGTLLVYVSYTDVTPEYDAERRLRESEQALEFAAETAGLWYWRYDALRDRAYMDVKNQEAFGVPPVVEEYLTTWKRLKIVQPEDWDAYEAAYHAVRCGEKHAGTEVRLMIRGSVHWARVNLNNLYNEAGEYVITVCTGFLIDAQKELQAKYEMERKKPSLGEKDLVIQGLFNVTTGEVMEYAYGDGTPVPIEERIAFSGREAQLREIIIDEEERQRFCVFNDREELLAHFANGETEFKVDYRRRMPGGEIKWVRNIMHLMRDPNGSDVLLFQYCYDVEEEKLQTLMYHSLASESYDYVARIDGRSKRFTTFPKAGETYHMPPRRGRDSDASIRASAQIIHPEDRESTLSSMLVANMKSNLKRQPRVQFVYRELQPDGGVRYKKIIQYYVDPQREIIAMVREDVTAIIREEAEKNAALEAALEAANQASHAKSQFLSRMSHELRTPMNAIIGLSTLAASDVNDPEAMDDAIGKIGMSARYLLSLINDILEMSRIESGHMTLNIAPFDFDKLIHSVNNLIYGQASEKGVDYDAVVNSYMESAYIGDVTKLQQILINVLGNAVKFTRAGGRITLSMEQLKRVGSVATLRFVVSDTGVGIDEAFLPHLFDAFSQESASFVSTSTGTGLGLAITKNMVDMMSGHISVQSVKNVGSVFTIDVQLTIPEASENAARLHSEPGLSALRVLVVDDDATVCKATQSMLASMGMEAEWADSGQAAVARVKEARADKRDFDAVFIDWKMPEMDGVETARRIRKLVRANTTIIIMTAYDYHAIEERARAAGVDLFVEKPLFQASIRGAFEKVFAGKKQKRKSIAPPKFDFTGKRILIAEDHPLNVEVARRLLEKVGARIVVANNGLEALETFTTAPDGFFDAILMDILMPVMDGMTATQSIRKLKKAGSREIPIIAMTANAFDEDVEMSLANGMDAHITKPIDPQVLYAAIQKLLEERKQ